VEFFVPLESFVSLYVSSDHSSFFYKLLAVSRWLLAFKWTIDN